MGAAGPGEGGGMIGLIDHETIELGKRIGLDVSGGSINKRDGRVRLTAAGKLAGWHSQPLRSRVVWWLHTGELLVGCEFDIHHRNHVRTDDRFDNLEKIGHIEHAKEHNPSTVVMVERVCRICSGTFQIKQWRLKDPSRGLYCGQACYQHAPKSEDNLAKQAEGLRRWHASLSDQEKARRSAMMREWHAERRV